MRERYGLPFEFFYGTSGKKQGTTLNIKSFIIYLFCLFDLLGHPSFGQIISTESELFNDKNGLSSFANYIHKDSRGIIWFGTQYGLYRYDGQNFQHFDEKSGLPFRQIMEIYEDSEGWFWLYRSCKRKPNCEKNLAFFHPLRQEVKTFEERFGTGISIEPYEIEGIFQSHSKIYFTANQKLFIWSSDTGIREFPIKGIEVTPKIWTQIEDDLLGAYFFENPASGYNLNFNTEIRYVAIDTNGVVKHPPQIFPIKGLSLDKIGQKSFHFTKLRINNIELSFFSDGRLKTDTLPLHFPCCPDKLEYFHFDEQIIINEAGQMFHPQIGQLKNPTENYIASSGIPVKSSEIIQTAWIKTNNNFHQINISEKFRHNFFDQRTQTAWLADANGITRFQYKVQQFQPVFNTVKNQQLATGALVVNEGQVLLGLGKNLFSWSSENKLTSLNIHTPPDAGKSVAHAFTKDSENTIWGLNRGHFLKMESDDLLLREYPIPPESITRPRCLFKRQSNLWIGDLKGIKIYDTERQVFSDFAQYNQFESVKNAIVHFFKESDAEHFWMGTDAGLFWCSDKKGILTKYDQSEKGKNYLPADNFFHISEAKKGGFWLATTSGLIRWKPFEDNTFKHYKNLPTIEILAAYEDDYGFVWMSTPQGLIQFQISTEKFKKYTEVHGLTNKGFQEYAHTKSADGTLFLGGYEGFNIFHPKDFKEVNFEPEMPLIITDFEQHIREGDTIEYRLEALINTAEIILHPGEKFFNIRVMLSDYRAAKKHDFAYKIEGYAEEWQETESNLIQIIGLPYGNFVLKIKGQTQDGLYAKPELEIPIRVLRPFYLQRWFLILATLISVLSVFLFFKIRTEQLIKQQKVLEQAVKEATETIRLKNESLKKDQKIIEQQAKELKRLDKLKSRFFTNISHEFRTPLTLIIEPLRQIISKPRAEEWLSKIKLAERNSRKLLRLVNQLLDLAKLEDGKISLDLRSGDISETIRPIYQSFLPLSEKKNIRLKLKIEKGFKPFYFDKGKVEMIVDNLMSNAIKFTNEGNVKLSVGKTENKLQIKVTDSGIGISKSNLPKVFDRFYQTDASSTRENEGTGIGLALTKELTELMGGSIQVESELNIGTTFIVWLPIILRNDQNLPNKESVKSGKNFNEENTLSITIEAPLSSTHHPSFITYHSKILLLIEDNPEMRQFIKHSLPKDYQIVEASNGQEGIKKATELIPDLVISDVMMPQKDGFEVTDFLKHDERTSHIPVILLTAKSTSESKIKGLKRGADAYLTKPFHTEELEVRIRKLIETRRLLQEKFSQKPVVKNRLSANPFSKIDNDFLRKFTVLIEKHLDNEALSIEFLSKNMNLSRSQLHRKIKALTGNSPTDFVRNYRLDHALELLKNKEGNVTQVSVMVGFGNEKYFSTRFKERFGQSPSQV